MSDITITTLEDGRIMISGSTAFPRVVDLRKAEPPVESANAERIAALEADVQRPVNWVDPPDQPAADPTYPCVVCGLPRTKAEGGTTFTVCDLCWDKQYKAEPPAAKPDTCVFPSVVFCDPPAKCCGDPPRRYTSDARGGKVMARWCPRCGTTWVTEWEVNPRSFADTTPGQRKHAEPFDDHDLLDQLNISDEVSNMRFGESADAADAKQPAEPLAPYTYTRDEIVLVAGKPGYGRIVAPAGETGLIAISMVRDPITAVFRCSHDIRPVELEPGYCVRNRETGELGIVMNLGIAVVHIRSDVGKAAVDDLYPADWYVVALPGEAALAAKGDGDE